MKVPEIKCNEFAVEEDTKGPQEEWKEWMISLKYNDFKSTDPEKQKASQMVCRGQEQRTIYDNLSDPATGDAYALAKNKLTSLLSS